MIDDTNQKEQGTFLKSFDTSNNIMSPQHVIYNSIPHGLIDKLEMQWGLTGRLRTALNTMPPPYTQDDIMRIIDRLRGNVDTKTRGSL